MTASTAATSADPDGFHAALTRELTATLNQALNARTREAFTDVLTADVRWGGEQPSSDECKTREQAGDHYAGLLAAGVTLHVVDLRPVDLPPTGATGPHASASGPGGAGQDFRASLQVWSSDDGESPSEMAVRLRLRDGLLAEICVLDPPATIEVLYFDGCPNHEAFLPHLTDLLQNHGIAVPLTLIRIDSDADAQAHRFLGSPTVRVNGRDVEPGAVERDSDEVRDGGGPYGVQCRLYPPGDGTGRASGTPHDQWILDALIHNPAPGTPPSPQCG